MSSRYQLRRQMGDLPLSPGQPGIRREHGDPHGPSLPPARRTLQNLGFKAHDGTYFGGIDSKGKLQKIDVEGKAVRLVELVQMLIAALDQKFGQRQRDVLQAADDLRQWLGVAAGHVKDALDG